MSRLIDNNHSFCSIDELARDMGIGKDTLRVWERRYGFPQPLRDERQQRRYPQDQVERLRLVKCLLDQGERPGQLLPLQVEELEARLSLKNQHPEASYWPIELIRAPDKCLQQLDLKQRQETPIKYIEESISPLIKSIGHYWAQGKIDIYQEHALSQRIERQLQLIIETLPVAEQSPSAILTTVPGERHRLGLSMVEYLLRHFGIHCINLGTETPIDQMVAACKSLETQWLMLSFSANQNRSTVLSTLHQLLEALPEGTQLVIGGDGVSRLRRLPDSVLVVKTMRQLKIIIQKGLVSS